MKIPLIVHSKTPITSGMVSATGSVAKPMRTAAMKMTAVMAPWKMKDFSRAWTRFTNSRYHRAAPVAFASSSARTGPAASCALVRGFADAASFFFCLARAFSMSACLVTGAPRHAPIRHHEPRARS